MCIIMTIHISERFFLATDGTREHVAEKQSYMH